MNNNDSGQGLRTVLIKIILQSVLECIYYYYTILKVKAGGARNRLNKYCSISRCGLRVLFHLTVIVSQETSFFIVPPLLHDMLLIGRKCES